LSHNQPYKQSGREGSNTNFIGLVFKKIKKLEIIFFERQVFVRSRTDASLLDTDQPSYEKCIKVKKY